jgi:DNA-binding FadR family transcriptional regulator
MTHELGRRIVTGACRPGEVLPNEEELCRAMGVSRSALREAVKVLAAKGLLDSRQRTGTRVRAPEHWHQLDPDVLAWRSESGDPRWAAQVAELRRIVEPAAAALAARRRTPAQLEAIEAAHAALLAAGESAPKGVAAVQFHAAVFAAAGNPLLGSLAALAAVAPGGPVAGDARAGLLEAIRRRDEQAASACMLALLPPDPR